MSQRSLLFDVYLEKVSTELNFFGILLREGTKGVVVKRVLPTVKCCQFSSREINAVEVGDILFAVNNVEVVGFSLKEVQSVIAEHDSDELGTVHKFRFRRNKSESQQIKQQILLHLQNSDGNLLDLYVELEDDPYEKATEFVSAHNLPESVIPVLVQQITRAFHEPVEGIDDIENYSTSDDSNEKDTAISNSFHRAKKNAFQRDTQSLSPRKLTRSLSFSTSPSLKSSNSPQKLRPLKNQEFFNRMHDEARKSRERKSLERSLVLKDYLKQIEQSSFRYQFQNHRHYDDSEKVTQIRDGKDVFEQLYNDHKHWWKKRNEKMERLKIEIENKRENELKPELTFSPRRATSPKHQVQRSFKTNDEFYDHLFSWTNYFSERLRQRKAQENVNFLSAATFSPELNSKSRMLAAKRRFRRRHSFDASSINTESIIVSRSNTPITKSPTSLGKLLPDAWESPPCEKIPVEEEVSNKFVPFEEKDSPAKDLTLNTEIIEKLKSFSVDEPSTQKDEFYWLAIANQSQTPVRLCHSDLESSVEYKSASDVQSSSEDVFQRLYIEGREEKMLNNRKLREKYAPVFSHVPDIGINTTYPIEKNKDDFFERLYKESDKQRTKDLMKKIEIHESLLQKSSKRSLSLKEHEAVVERLMFKQAKVEKAKEMMKESIYEKFRTHSRSTFISEKTELLARKKMEHSLQEIFQVLLLTEQMNKERGNSVNKFGDQIDKHAFSDAPKVKPNEELISIKRESSDTFLDLEFVDARHIEPLELSQAIQQILLSFIEESAPQKIVTLPQFIERSMELIKASVLPSPICHLLTPLHGYERRKREQKLHLSTEDRIILENVQEKPKLVAEKVTNKLTDDRYRDRKHKKVSIEDSLLSYIEINKNKMEMLKREIEEEKTAECTFQPMLIASYFRDQAEERKQSNSRRIRSRSAPSRTLISENQKKLEPSNNLQDIRGLPSEILINSGDKKVNDDTVAKNYLLSHTNYFGRNEWI